MGANILANMAGHQGEECILDAGCALCAPIKKWEIYETVKNALFGIFDKVLGEGLNKLMLFHLDSLDEVFKSRFKIDLKHHITSNPPSITFFDDTITAPAFGYKDR